jgi:hypothetical protein
MKLYETESLSEKQRDKLTSYFKLAKKEFQNGCTSCYDSLFEKRRRQIMGIFAGKCDRNADMWLTYLCSEQKIYSGYK